MSDVIKLSSPTTGEFWEIEVLFEDADLLALDKPAGLPSAPDPDNTTRPSLVQLLHAAIADRKPWAEKRGLSFLMPAHRLDAEASGAVVLAKNKPALLKLADLFGSEKPLRRFVALVQGAPAEDRFAVDAKLGPHPARPNLMRIHRHGKRSRTTFEVRERFDGWTLLQCDALTDRPHQLRVHLKSAGLPIVADSLYGGRPLLLSRLKSDYRLKPNQQERPLISRPALHAEELLLPHPAHDASLRVTAPWPKDLQVALKYLRRYAPGR